ncbi:hypothetical protein JXQ70_08430 [bacterium]|nr:hypothetical protein [bacterium]
MRTLWGLFIGVMVLLASGALYAAPGDTCATATVISTLPYTDANTNNCSCTDDAVDYSSCMSYYDSGYDGFYEYTNNTGADFLVEVCAIDNIGGDYLGVGLYEGCPTAGATCLGFMGGYTVNSCFSACLENGVTYYILVDNWASPYCADDYTLTLTNEGPCPTPPANDDCSGVIALSCDSCTEGSVFGAVNDFNCSGGSVTVGPDIVYSFTLAASRQVTIIAEADYDMDIGISTVCDDGSAATLLCADTSGTHTDPSCGDITHNTYGYATWSQTLAASTYYIWVDSYSGATAGNFALEILCDDPCDFDCPTGSVPEAEPCGDDLNGGCNTTPYTFEPINSGDTVCGTAWADAGSRDTDWYEITAPFASNILTWTGMAEFPFQLIVVTNTSDCNIAAGEYILDTGLACEEVTLSATVPAGVYWLWAGPSDFYNTTCGALDLYYATVTCEEDLYVDLISFDASKIKKGVRLDWETAVEIDVLGFNLYRQQLRKDGSFGKMSSVNANLIPSQGNAFMGAKYSFVDPDIAIGQTYRYTLKSVELSSESKELATTDITIRDIVRGIVN